VLDELHTYRGRQGADVAMLVRRVREAVHTTGKLQCVGTSATMSTAETIAKQRKDVADVATQIFGTLIEPCDVITETLTRATRPGAAIDLGELVDARGGTESKDPRLSAGYEQLSQDPLAEWIEQRFGLTKEPETGILVRRTPTTVEAEGKTLADLTGKGQEACRTAIQQTLLAGARVSDPESKRPLFAFRLHQFISKGASIYVTLEPEETRAIEHSYQVVLAGSSGGSDTERRLYPLAFCRDCGQEYLMVRRDTKQEAFVARTRMQIRDEHDGYLYIDTSDPWPSDPVDRVPDAWTQVSAKGTLRVIPSRRDRVPQAMMVNPMGKILEDGNLSEDLGAIEAVWIPKGLLFCLRCGTTYHLTWLI